MKPFTNVKRTPVKHTGTVTREWGLHSTYRTGGLTVSGSNQTESKMEVMGRGVRLYTGREESGGRVKNCGLLVKVGPTDEPYSLTRVVSVFGHTVKVTYARLL